MVKIRPNLTIEAHLDNEIIHILLRKPTFKKSLTFYILKKSHIHYIIICKLFYLSKLPISNDLLKLDFYQHNHQKLVLLKFNTHILMKKQPQHLRTPSGLGKHTALFQQCICKPASLNQDSDTSLGIQLESQEHPCICFKTHIQPTLNNGSSLSSSDNHQKFSLMNNFYLKHYQIYMGMVMRGPI